MFEVVKINLLKQLLETSSNGRDSMLEFIVDMNLSVSFFGSTWTLLGKAIAQLWIQS